ncbi:hypothetical protein NDU88_005119 [Pleurodeles waltl]|uniref:Uncharacterized protein n=1 Tax=Pleurodeles waltl TaxID=8319 RepID=A0AAV7VK56_PLEWA|nr:hypothetical protein NDU88_005119 [Pleurodeles waltl]
MQGEWCAGEGQDRQWAKEKDGIRGAPFIPKPRSLPRRCRAPMPLEVAAPRLLSGHLTATLIPLELLLPDALGRRLPRRGTSDQLCAPGGSSRLHSTPVHDPDQPSRGALMSGGHLVSWPDHTA